MNLLHSSAAASTPAATKSTRLPLSRSESLPSSNSPFLLYKLNNSTSSKRIEELKVYPILNQNQNQNQIHNQIQNQDLNVDPIMKTNFFNKLGNLNDLNNLNFNFNFNVEKNSIILPPLPIMKSVPRPLSLSNNALPLSTPPSSELSSPLPTINSNNTYTQNNEESLPGKSKNFTIKIINNETDHAKESDSQVESEISDDSDVDIDNENESSLIQEISPQNKEDRTKYKCNHSECRYKGTFLSKDYLRRHIREQHRRTKGHICQGYNKDGTKWGCSKKFNRPYQLVNHWRGQRSLKRCGVPINELKKSGIIKYSIL